MTFKKKYGSRYDILRVLLKTREKKTSVIKEELSEILSQYKDASLKLFTRGLLQLEEEGFVKKINKPKDIAHYWTITNEGEEKRKELENKEK